MKTNTFRILNIIAINLLLLALYLNFFHEDNNTAPEIPVKASKEQRIASVQNTNQLINTTMHISGTQR
jgi:hypothetical protein